MLFIIILYILYHYLLYNVKWLESLFMQSVFHLISKMYVGLCYFSFVLLWGCAFHLQCNSCPTDARAVWRSYALSSMRHHCAKEGRMWLAPVHGLSHWDLLGYQRTSLGSKGKGSFFFSSRMCVLCRCYILISFKGPGDTSGGCRCKMNNQRCHPKCQNCHWKGCCQLLMQTGEENCEFKLNMNHFNIFDDKTLIAAIRA